MFPTKRITAFDTGVLCLDTDSRSSSSWKQELLAAHKAYVRKPLCSLHTVGKQNKEHGTCCNNLLINTGPIVQTEVYATVLNQPRTYVAVARRQSLACQRSGAFISGIFFNSEQHIWVSLNITPSLLDAPRYASETNNGLHVERYAEQDKCSG